MKTCSNFYLGWGLTVICFGGLLGCNSGPQIVNVSGIVTRNGKPVPNATIHFCPEKGRASWGVSDDQGQFTLHYDKKRQGALVGKHRVYVEFKPKSAKDEDLMARGEWVPHPDFKDIVEKYGKLETTPLTEEVGPTDNQTIEIKLD